MLEVSENEAAVLFPSKFMDTRGPHFKNGCLWVPGILIIEASKSHSRHTTVGRTPLDEWLSTMDIHAPGGIWIKIPTSEGPQTHALKCAANRIGKMSYNSKQQEIYTNIKVEIIVYCTTITGIYPFES